MLGLWGEKTVSLTIGVSANLDEFLRVKRLESVDRFGRLRLHVPIELAHDDPIGQKVDQPEAMLLTRFHVLVHIEMRRWHAANPSKGAYPAAGRGTYRSRQHCDHWVLLHVDRAGPLGMCGRPSVVDATLPNDHRDDISPPQRLATVADAFDSGRSGGDHECKRSSVLPEDDENRKPMDDSHLVERGFGV